ncbi:Cytochrome P450 [Streptoalloteichus tenebrarius]|uniref:Cytochrome P450 n=1 Tax=Streptoalloteichus tenebrarius (strain ATCC 17920 / DSM 40477 / JCM 4838 / CBS 697.72 / NBRC 16177 / NCIMB 11028 / NRRL B-12390 / A12253. 1 / ISP 5477) TaxID=1933 RepID=A0ABT1HQ58_STRSD|nr:hypothetical protein [Streptoalloteichus tenebrarius]MCP2257650.1 Cytochrome P450 [Streptoalloteichus tenebrarius]BFE98611.1 hypothetical protein GCM10020241_02870 [Streptoalloteichus tenebrarius]
MSVDRHITTPAQVAALLDDPTFTVPPVPTGGPTLGIRWLRRSVARFSEGEHHQHRRRLAVTLLSTVDPTELRHQAHHQTTTLLDTAAPDPIDLISQISRVIPVRVLATALGAPTAPISAVATAAQAYQPHTGDEEPANHAVAELAQAFNGGEDDTTAAKIALLIQTYDATAGLIGNAARTMLRTDTPNTPTETIVTTTLRRQPPVRRTRRTAKDTGETITLDLATSNLPFGAGRHQCPGRTHALAITTGILDALHGARLAEHHIDHEPSTTPHIPTKILVTR